MLRNTYGYVREFNKDVEDTREVEFIISSAAKDRHNSILNMDGWNLENFNRNPIVGYQHNVYGNLFGNDDPDDIIGSGRAWIDINQKGEKVLMGSVKFETKDINEKADKIFKKVLAGTLRSTSVGFMEIGKGEWRETRDTEGKKDKVYHFKGQELLEFSIVNIPSNPEAVKKALGDDKQRLMDFIVKFMPDDISVKQVRDMRVQDVLDMIDGTYAGENIEEVKENLNKFSKLHQLNKNKLSQLN
jgi:hypothetical protein